jgi:hypothetical protein
MAVEWSFVLSLQMPNAEKRYDGCVKKCQFNAFCSEKTHFAQFICNIIIGFSNNCCTFVAVLG